MTKEIVTFKGFNKDLKCRDFQFEIGKTFHHDGKVEACGSGFHACECPFDVFSYYSPADSRFAETISFGITDREEDGDTKIASASITIKAELTLPQFIQRGIEWIWSKIDKSLEQQIMCGNRSAATNTGDRSAATNTGDRSAATNTGYWSAATNTGYCSAATNTGDRSAATNTGDRSAATNTGYCSAATNTGYWSAATNTGDRSAATNTGYCSAATNTGYWSAATNTGNRSAATNTGDRSAATNTGDRSAATNTGNRSAAEVSGSQSVAAAFGIEGKARASEGGAIVLCYRDEDGELIHIRASKVGENGIMPNTWYQLNEDGEFVACE
ncbi:Gp53 [Salmonella enterica subsp. enterica]|uniref:Gp53 n=2 Tax=Salmonella enterica I TaxID=59201 RepID=A0A379V1Z0_SALET|nr:Gp53 [Salmonella enterica subsp. enterica]